MITKTLYDNLYRLATLQRFTMEDSKQLQYAIQHTINSSYSVCLKCKQQLKHGQKLILNYLKSVEVIEELPSVIDEPSEVIPFEPAIEVDVNEAEKLGCEKCKSKKKSTTTRKPRTTK